MSRPGGGWWAVTGVALLVALALAPLLDPARPPSPGTIHLGSGAVVQDAAPDTSTTGPPAGGELAQETVPHRVEERSLGDDAPPGSQTGAGGDHEDDDDDDEDDRDDQDDDEGDEDDDEDDDGPDD